MKISVGINCFKDFNSLNKRERLCVEGLLKLKNVNLYNICFNNEYYQYDNFTCLNALTKKSNIFVKNYFNEHGINIITLTKELPSVKEIFDVLASTDCDYFLFLNSDVIISNRLFKEMENGYECYPISRVNINEINSLTDIPEIIEYCVHGFDAFLVKKETWLRIRDKFDDFILGKFYWDTCFATLFNLYCKCKNINKLPPVCFHIDHPNVSAQETPEHYYCTHLVTNKYKTVLDIWFSYVYNVLFKRLSNKNCKYYYPLANELELEKKFFKSKI
jgi:hypothetical protein